MKMKIKLFIGCILISILLCCSGCSMLCKTMGIFCQESTEIPVLNIQGDIKETQEIIKENSIIIKKISGNVEKEAQSINKETTKIQEKIPEEIKPEIDPHLDSIKNSSNSIVDNTKKIDEVIINLSSASTVLDKTNKKVKTKNEVLFKLKKERDDAIKAKDEQIHKILRWLIVGCVVGTGAFGVLFVLHGSKAGMIGAVMCATVLVIAIFVEKYFAYLAIVGGGIIIGLVGILIYNIIIRKRAFKEVVNTVEVAQDNMEEGTRDKIFGGKEETGIMDGIQSKSTMVLVKKEKNKMSNLWSYAKNKKN